MSDKPRTVCITAADGQTGFLIAELLLTNPDYADKVGSVTALCLNPASEKGKELAELGANVVPHKPGRLSQMVTTLKKTGCDTVCLIPPPHSDKFDITVELIEATKKAGIPNVLFMSSAGCDFADPQKQPRLHEFLELEALALATKGDKHSKTGTSPVVIRSGFYAENILLYAPQIKEERLLPLPIGSSHCFAPVALGDVAQLAGQVLIGKGKNGFDDKHRGQLMVLTGPTLVTGDELAANASKSLKTEIKFEDISQAEAKKVLSRQSQSEDSEKEYILDYYSLVREGKANYISTIAFHYVTGNAPMQPTDRKSVV